MRNETPDAAHGGDDVRLWNTGRKRDLARRVKVV
jgi:hypothetical protein